MNALRVLEARGILHVFAFLVGASVGSFLNVVIYRWPRGLSLLRPGSHCPYCRTPIAWFDNIPLLSFLVLGGRCRWCASRISPRYFVVETLCGVWAVLMLWRFGVGVEMVAGFILGAGFLAASAIDFDHRLLPDTITLGAIPLGLFMAWLPKSVVPGWPVSLLDSVIGAVAGAGLFYLVIVIFKFLTGKEGMGSGDVKLMAGIGAVLGYSVLHIVVIIAAVSGIVYWLALAFWKKVGRDYPVPFGPFLSAGALIVLLSWPWLMKHLALILV